MSNPRPRPRPASSNPPTVEPAVAPPPPAPVTPPPDAPAPDAPPPVAPATAEYTEQLIVPTQLLLAAVVAVVAALILLALGLWPLTVVAVLAVGAVAYYLGVQILTVDPVRITVAQGRGDNAPYVVRVTDVATATAVTLTWPQCFGIGLPDTVDTSRFTVRAGPAVALTMRDGELLQISAADPRAVLSLLGR